MIEFLIRRLLQALLAMWAMSVIVFVGVFAIGNPVDIFVSPDATEAQRAATIHAFGLDLPLWRQYLAFAGKALHGDLGRSFIYDEPALRLILERMPATLELAIGATLVAVLLGLPLGLYAGLKPKSPFSSLIMGSSILGFSLPTFWVGIVLIMIFAVKLGWLPSGGRGATRELLGMQWSFLTRSGLAHLALPVLNLALFQISMVIRLTRAGVAETVVADYIRFARAKGLTDTRIVCVHVFKVILIPVVTVIGLNLGSLIAYSVVTETIFSWPGMGKLIIDSIGVLDRPVLVSYLMLMVLAFITINLCVDLAYSALDPRVRLGAKR
jgi:peptide/nickel transport system permease protein